MLLDKQSCYMEKNKIDLVIMPHAKVDFGNKVSNVKVKITQLLEENVAFLYDLKFGKDLLNKTSNIKSMKKKG